MSTQVTAPPPIPTTWWQRNWKWVVPTAIVASVALLACFVGLVMLGAIEMFRATDVFRDAMVQVRSSPAVVRELGEPIEPTWLVSGSINSNDSSGNADFAIALKGPSGRGTLYVKAEKNAGRWNYTVLEVAVDGKTDRIDLLKDAGRA